MANNQEWFDKENSKEAKEIEIEYEDFQGQLVVEDYSQLDKLYLLDIKNIDKVTLKNLPNLQECTVWDCGTKDLIIENCPKIKKLNVRRNLLTNLEFLKNLENLEELEIDNNTEIDSGLEFLPGTLKVFSCTNTKLVEFLKPYQEDWKSYKKNLQELVELANQKPQELLKTISDLKKNQQIILDNTVDFEKKYQELKRTLNFLLKKEQLKTEEANLLVTKDLLEIVGNLKDNLNNKDKFNQEELTQNEKNLFLQEEKVRDFEEKLKLKEEFQKREEKLLDSFFVFKEFQQQKAKIVDSYTTFLTEKELIKDLINIYLEFRQAKKQKLPSIKQEKECSEIKAKILSKLGEEAMKEVEALLTNCDKLVDLELELENKRLQIEENNLIYYQKNSQNLISSLQENQIIQAKNKRIAYLEKRIEKLCNLIIRLKVKIIEAHSHFFQEKELLQSLIRAHLDFIQIKKQKLPSVKLGKQKQEIYQELESKVGERGMEEVEIVLTDCEELVNLEYQLVESQTELKENKEFIQESEKYVFDIANKVNVQEGTAMISSEIGNQDDLINSNKQLIGSPQQKFQVHTLQPPKSN